MKTPLFYQLSEYDCGTTSLLNAVKFLFPRELIPPDVIKAITAYSLDAYDSNGEVGRRGTSAAAMRFIADWLNHNGPIKGLPIHTVYYSGDCVHITAQSAIVSGIQADGVAILRLNYGGPHYVLATQADRAAGYLYLFDPYLDEDLKYTEGIILIDDAPYSYNRKVPFSFFESTATDGVYALGESAIREAVILQLAK